MSRKSFRKNTQNYTTHQKLRLQLYLVNQAVIFPKSSADGEMPIQFIEFFYSDDAEIRGGPYSFRITLLLLRSQKMQTSYC